MPGPQGEAICPLVLRTSGTVFPQLPVEGDTGRTNRDADQQERARSAVRVGAHPSEWLLKGTAASGPRTKHPGKGGESV